MIEFFSHAATNLHTGTFSYIKELLEARHQEKQHGLVEINFEQRGRINILFLRGEVVGAYYITATSSDPMPVSDLDKWWTGESAYIRSHTLPAAAVRIIRMACEWHPPVQSLLIQSSSLQNILQVFQVNKTSGLLHVSDPAYELAVPLMDGFCISNEAVYSGGQFEIGPPALNHGLQSASNSCTVVVFEAKPDTASFKHLVLRQVVSELVSKILARYNQIVGGSLLAALDNELNQVFQLSEWQMQLVVDRLEDFHVFSSLEEAARCYNILFQVLYAHMTQVIGAGLAGKLLKEAYSSLNPRSQAVIDAQPILNGIQ